MKVARWNGSASACINSKPRSSVWSSFCSTSRTGIAPGVSACRAAQIRGYHQPSSCSRASAAFPRGAIMRNRSSINTSMSAMSGAPSMIWMAAMRALRISGVSAVKAAIALASEAFRETPAASTSIASALAGSRPPASAGLRYDAADPAGACAVVISANRVRPRSEGSAFASSAQKRSVFHRSSCRRSGRPIF